MPAMHVLGMPVLHMPVVSRKPVLRGQLHTAALLRLLPSTLLCMIILRHHFPHDRRVVRAQVIQRAWNLLHPQRRLEAQIDQLGRLLRLGLLLRLLRLLLGTSEPVVDSSGRSLT